MPSPIKLRASDPLLTELCRTIEESLASVEELHGLSIPVQLLLDFRGLPEAERSQVVRDTYAAYRRSTATIYVNGEALTRQPINVMQAVVAHEIGHAYAHTNSLMEASSQYRELGDYAEEFLADRLACLWGFHEGLQQERLASYGKPYAAALDLWQDESAYCRAMRRWHIQRLAGIL
jgi:hypothetical protein